MARASLKTEKKSKEQKAGSKEEKLGSNPSALPSASPDPEPEAPQFIEALPADFWDQEATPVSSYNDDTEQGSQTRSQSWGKVESPISHPLFAELQSLFPGKIIRFEAAKTTKNLEETPEVENVEDASSATELITEDNDT